ncbi:MAG: hypothetical protein QXH30_00415 [Candidatus Bilamarchaeaceae archaeon]
MNLNDILSQLEIRELPSLFPHEQTIPKNLKRLQEAMFNTGHMVDPIIIDRSTGVILDGNHRFSVLKAIEIPNAVVQPVDYESPRIGLGTWLPVCENHLSVFDFQKLGEATETVDYETGKSAVDSMKAIFMMMKEKGGKTECALISPGSYNLASIAEEQKRLLSALSALPFEYYPDDRFQEYVVQGRVALYRRSYTKKEVVREALAGRPFPPKSTRHTIPDRIIRLNMRLGWLLEDKQTSHELLKEMLSHRVYSGNVRRYPEPVIVIY